MGLSTKQVSGDGLDWGRALLQAGALELPKPPSMRRQQQQQPQAEPLKCPRCDSSNTKFCYYNNYNKSQPRHFCKACKRHWTKGGTLRNVPVGGGRKNKRPKTSNTTNATTSTISTTTTTTTNTNINQKNNTRMPIQTQQQRQGLPLALADQNNFSDILYQALIRPPYSLPHDSINSSSNNLNDKSFSNSNGVYLNPTPSLPQDQKLQFPFSSSSSFESNPSSISAPFQSPNAYNYIGGTEAISQPWQVPPTSSVMDMTSYWSWDDINTFVSTDLNLPWEDFENKP
ncbi:hypothetical protein L1049_010519 [Liquidambar formosana]|uniref:Dof zinc finger protein n=1 Tax=Liquidambar formosana TaxID=63359 RepID=A0AAP0R4D6_LIQFO